MNGNNPATRLWGILVEARETSSSESCRSVWMRVLGISSGKTVDLLSALRDVHILLDDTLELVNSRSEMNRETYRNNIEALRSPLDPVHLNSSWNDVRQRIPETSLIVLQLAGDWLKVVASEEEIPAGEIDRLREEVEELLQEVISVDLPEDLRDFMVRQLEQVRTACLTYRLRGARAFREARERIAGAFVLEKKTAEAAKDSTVGESFDKILGRFSALVDFSSRARKLLEPYVPFIMGLLGP